MALSTAIIKLMRCGKGPGSCPKASLLSGQELHFKDRGKNTDIVAASSTDDLIVWRLLILLFVYSFMFLLL